jgi:hypothetical protein
MKVRIVEYRANPRQSLTPPISKAKIRASVKVTELEDPLTHYDPDISEGWAPLLTAQESVQARTRMFYGVTSIAQIDAGEYADDELPGAAYELEFENGETLTVHHTLIAETEAEVSTVA